MRFQRFDDEIVRLSEAISREDVDACINWLTGTPLLALKLTDFDPEKSTFFLNFYDFWNNNKFEALIADVRYERSARRSSASGAVWYSITAREVGPLVTGGLMQALLSGLMAGLNAWSNANSLISSLTLETLADALVGQPVGILASQAEGSVAAFQAQKNSAANVMAGGAAKRTNQAVGKTANSGPTTSNTTDAASATATLPTGAGAQGADIGVASSAADFLTTAESLSNTAREVIAAVHVEEIAIDRGRVDWSSQAGGLAALKVADTVAMFAEIEAEAAQQAVGGMFFGMSDRDFQAYLSSGGQGVGPYTGSVDHTVLDTDTAQSIEGIFGVAWATILEGNRLTPQEALRAGRVLKIPSLRPRPSPVEGLPTFGSHVGKSAWGVDMRIDMTQTASGDIDVVSGGDCILQGVEVIIAEFSEYVMDGISEIPPEVREAYIADRLTGVLSTDPRLTNIQKIGVQVVDGAFDVSVSASTINGGTIRSGGA